MELADCNGRSLGCARVQLVGFGVPPEVPADLSLLDAMGEEDAAVLEAVLGGECWAKSAYSETIRAADEGTVVRMHAKHHPHVLDAASEGNPFAFFLPALFPSVEDDGGRGPPAVDWGALIASCDDLDAFAREEAEAIAAFEACLRSDESILHEDETAALIRSHKGYSDRTIQAAGMALGDASGYLAGFEFASGIQESGYDSTDLELDNLGLEDAQDELARERPVVVAGALPGEAVIGHYHFHESRSQKAELDSPIHSVSPSVSSLSVSNEQEQAEEADLDSLPSASFLHSTSLIVRETGTTASYRKPLFVASKPLQSLRLIRARSGTPSSESHNTLPRSPLDDKNTLHSNHGSSSPSSRPLPTRQSTSPTAVPHVASPSPTKLAQNYII
jgi:hypothetical protein